jgi:YHS domain-containing protein
MFVIPAVFTAVLALAPASAQMPAPREALDGIDPVVLLTQGKEITGKPELKITRGGFEYLFTTAETRAAFEKQPEKYEIQLGGMCAKMAGGAMGNPADYAVVDGKIYVFGTDDCHKKFVAAPAKYLEKPALPMPSSAQDLQRGRALIDKAVKAIGGGPTLDAITTYVETSSVIQKRPTGDVPVVLKTMWKFPGAVRAERTMTAEGRTMTSASLLTPAGAWFIGQSRRAFPQNPEGRKSTEQEFGRQLVPLLRGRHDADFKAAWLGRAMVDGVEVDRVRVRNGVVDATLGLEKATGAVHSLTFTARNREGEVGEYVIVFADPRDVSGLRLPFSQRALFNGEPDTSLTRTIDAITINVPLDAALFEPGTGGGQ